jgi:hypothetical protein
MRSIPRKAPRAGIEPGKKYRERLQELVLNRAEKAERAVRKGTEKYS